MIAGRGNTRMRAMLRTYTQKAPTPRWLNPPAEETVMVLDLPDEGRSTLVTQCRHCGAKYRWDIVPEQCLLCGKPMTPTRRS